MLKPLDSKLIVRPDAIKTELIPGISLPETAQEVPYRGIVISKGKNVDEIEVGDYAIYSKYSGTDVEDEGVIYRVLEKKDVTAYKSK